MGRDQGAAIPHAFIGQLPPEFIPSGIADCACESSVTDHTLNMKILDRNRLVFTHERGGQ